LKAPVAYAGSIERTSIAEMDEIKGFMIMAVAPTRPPRMEFHPLPARPMLLRELDLAGMSERDLESRLRALLADVPGDAILRLLVAGEPVGEAARILSAENLRNIAPATMNVDVRTANGFFGQTRRRGTRTSMRSPELPFPPAASPQRRGRE
jgi:hypothetical protein